ncbi:MAG: 50S ribosomal protein L22 [Nanoarchaeota archaeon]
MSTYTYAFKDLKENMAKSVGRDLNISFKQAIEIAGMLRNKELEKAQQALKRVLAFEQAVPFKRFTNGLGHKPGISSGRYPQRACTAILKVLNEVEANSQNKGLGKCRIIHIRAQQASRPMHYGRKMRTRMKRAHVEVVVQEIEPAKGKREQKSEQKQDKKEEKTRLEKQGGENKA